MIGTAPTTPHLPDPRRDLRAVLGLYDGAATHKLLTICCGLAAMNGRAGEFTLSSHDAAQRIGLTPMQAWKLLRMLEADGVVKVVEVGAGRRVTRYRWLGG